MRVNKIINFQELKKSFSKFHKNKPFSYCVIDNFFKIEYAKKLER